MSHPGGLRRDEGPIAGASRVRVQMFPLLATLDRLQELCDRQFNDWLPPSIAIFRPALPLVVCGVLHYPDMGDALPYQTGTLSQNEMYFLVPLERYRLVNGREELVEIGVTTPFIFVDNAESVADARARFGMAKELAQFSTNQPDLPWDVGAQEYLRISAWEPSDDGHQLGPLLDILHSGIATGTPPPPFDSLAGLKLLDEMRQLITRELDPGSASEALKRMQAYFSTAASKRECNLFSLRQFPDPEDPVRARYQDLIAFRMKVVDIQTAGLLGQGPLLSQFQLRLRHSEYRPISRLLGLRVVSRTQEDSKGDQDTFDTIEPFMPIYAQSDIDLEAAERICWRYSSGAPTQWVTEDGKTHGKPEVPALITEVGPSDTPFLYPEKDPPLLDLKFLMLPARRVAVEALLAKMIPAESAPYVKVRLLSKGDYTGVRVLFSRSRPRAHPETTLMWTDGTSVTMSVPVEVLLGESRIRANFFLQDFSDNPLMVQSLRAMLAEPMAAADFSDGKDGWFGSTRPVATLLSLETLAVKQSSSGAEVVNQPLMDVLALDIATTDLRDVAAELWPHMFQILPALSVGHVPWSHDRNKSIFDRVMLATYDHLDTFQIAKLPPGRPQAIRFHDNATYPICEATGLVTLDDQSEVVPVIAYGEATSCVRLERFTIICETTPAGGT